MKVIFTYKSDNRTLVGPGTWRRERGWREEWYVLEHARSSSFNDGGFRVCGQTR